MKPFGTKTSYRLKKQTLLTAGCVVAVAALCSISAVAVNTLLNYSDVQALRVNSGDMVDIKDVIPVEYAPDRDSYGFNTPEYSEETKSAGKMKSADPDTPSDDEEAEYPDDTEATEATKVPEETTAEPTKQTTEAETTTAETTPAPKATEPPKNAAATKAPTKKPAKKITESAFKKTVYARTTVNIRTGPGNNYKFVRKVTVNKPVRVVAKTSNGWYKTSDGNYIKQSLTTLSSPKPTATKAPTKKPTKKTTKKPTKAPAKKTTTVATKTTVKKVNGVKCRIVFYGPVLYKKKDGSTFYSTTTATGTKCKQGRTCAADWKVFPKNSWIYIENDPLGGDGLYKVEDTGRFTGNMIDIYVDNPKKFTNCIRTVYKQ